MIRTTGGSFTEESRRTVVSNICKVFYCHEKDVEELVPVQAGLTNVVLSFKLNGGKYVCHHPGLNQWYHSSRGFSIDDPAQFFPGHHEERVFKSINDVAAGKDLYKGERNKLLPSMHRYQDGNSSNK